MAKTKITFTYGDDEYTLEFTAASLKAMDKAGFDFSEITKHVFTAPEELFCGAFIANHSDVPRKTRIAIYEALKGVAEGEGDEDTLENVLATMLTEAVNEITNRKGNVMWKVQR